MKANEHQPTDQNSNLTEYLYELAWLARNCGADSVWFIREAQEARLTFAGSEAQTVRLDVPDVDARLSLSFSLDLQDAGILMVIQFSAGDGGQPGVEKFDGGVS